MIRSGRGQAQRKQHRATGAAARPDIAEKVLQYFRQNSDATVSVEGIARFWVRQETSVVEQVLADLHAHGRLDRRTIAGTDFYSLRKEPPPPSHPKTAAGPAPQVEGRGRFLVVVDAEVREFLVETLSEEGHSVAAAESGDLAVEMLRSNPFDLTVTDLLMPGLSGIDVLQAAKEHDPRIEVIVVTAHASIEAAIKAQRSGAYDLITKPLDDLELLYRGVERALERRRLSSENRLLNAHSPEQTRKALETIQKGAGSKQDPEVVAALPRVVEESLTDRGGGE